jgi:hypothetical protein
LSEREQKIYEYFTEYGTMGDNKSGILTINAYSLREADEILENLVKNPEVWELTEISDIYGNKLSITREKELEKIA